MKRGFAYRSEALTITSRCLFAINLGIFSRNEQVATYFPENPFADITLFLNSIPTFIT